MYSRQMTVAALAAILVVAAAQAAFADSGSFREVRSFHQQYITVDHGGERFTGGILRGTVTIVDSSGGPFVAGTNRPTDCLVFSHSSDDGIALQAPCTSTDADGDIMYSRAHPWAGRRGRPWWRRGRVGDTRRHRKIRRNLGKLHLHHRVPGGLNGPRSSASVPGAGRNASNESRASRLPSRQGRVPLRNPNRPIIGSQRPRAMLLPL